MKNKKLKNILVNKNSSIKETMRAIDKNGLGIAFIIDKQKKLFGAVTDGDIRRVVLKGINIGKPIEQIANKKPIFIKEKAVEKEIAKLKNNKNIKRKIPAGGSLKVPIVDEKGMVENIIFIYADEKKVLQNKKNKAVFGQGGVKRVLIIGGAGYLGSMLCQKLLNKGYSVRVLDNLTYGDEGIKGLYKNKKFEFLKGDIRNISKTIEAVRGMDAVIHLAAIVGDPACQLDPKETIEINYLATKSVAETCKFNQINRFLFASTCSVYGANKDAKERLKENSFLKPVSLYAETKLKSEEGILTIRDENFSPTIFRFATLYGVSPRMRFDLVINLMAAKALIDKKITIFGGKQWRPNLEVGDAAEACLKWVESSIEKSGGEIFNVGINPQNYRILEIGRAVKKVMPGTEIEIKKEEGDMRDYNVSFDKISRMLNFKAKKTIERGISEIKKMVESKKIKDFNESKYNNYRFLSRTGERHAFK